MKQKFKVISLLLLVFVAPVVLSILVYMARDYFSFPTSEHGTLLEKPVYTGSLMNLPNHQWKIIYKPSLCTSLSTNEVLFKLQQIRRALGRDKERVTLLLITDSGCTRQPLYGFQVLAVDTLQKKRLAANITNDVIYLADPRDFLFMYYRPNANPLDIYVDMKKLLQLSQIG